MTPFKPVLRATVKGQTVKAALRAKFAWRPGEAIDLPDVGGDNQFDIVVFDGAVYLAANFQVCGAAAFAAAKRALRAVAFVAMGAVVGSCSPSPEIAKAVGALAQAAKVVTR